MKIYKTTYANEGFANDASFQKISNELMQILERKSQNFLKNEFVPTINREKKNQNINYNQKDFDPYTMFNISWYWICKQDDFIIKMS